MTKTLIRFIYRFIVIVLAQILIFNNIELSGFITPYIYLLFILLLPFETPNWLVLLLGFVLGYTMDFFSDTMGMHTAATVFSAYLRPFALRLFSPREGYDKGIQPRVHFLGLFWFVRYTAILIIAHNMVLFYAEIFGFQNFFFTLFRVLVSAIVSVVVIVFSQYFVFRK